MTPRTWTWRQAGWCANLGWAWHDHAPDEQKGICWLSTTGNGPVCPVMRQCYEDAHTSFESWNFGTWGGLTEQERRRLGYHDETRPRHPGIEAAPVKYTGADFAVEADRGEPVR